MGANLCPEADLNEPVTNFAEILPYMDGFHKRYMNSNKVCRFWVTMVRQLDIEMMVPQHGRALTGRAIPDFLDYIKNLQCGMDLFTQANYVVP